MSRRLIINADDFGASTSINEAVIRAHEEGILSTASLMVNGAAFEQAVEMARNHPDLGVGLHLCLVMGKSSLPCEEIPGLVGLNQRFADSALWAGVRYFFHPGLQEQLRQEIHAQFKRFTQTGLRLDHVNGHLHMHLHPTVFEILMTSYRELNIRHMRLTHDSLWMNRGLSRGRRFYRYTHAIIYRSLRAKHRTALMMRNIRHTDYVFGLMENGRVHEAYVVSLLRRLPEGVSELYSHPCLHHFKHEFEALVSPAVRQVCEERGVNRIRYQDLV